MLVVSLLFIVGLVYGQNRFYQWGLQLNGTCNPGQNEVTCVAKGYSESMTSFIDPETGVDFQIAQAGLGPVAQLNETRHFSGGPGQFSASGVITFQNAGQPPHTTMTYVYNNHETQQVRDPANPNLVIESNYANITGGSGVWDGCSGIMTMNADVNTESDHFRPFVFANMLIPSS